MAVLPVFAATVLGCGGGGGAGFEDAYCEAADEIEFGNDLDEQADAIDDLAGDAPDELEDQFDLLVEATEAAADGDAEALEDIDPDDVEDAVDEIADATDDGCDGVRLRLDVDLPDADDLDGGDSTTTTTEAEEPIDGDDEQIDALVAACEDGGMVACDDLFFATPVGSPEEEVGFTCGGLLAADDPDATGGNCDDLFGDGDGDGGDGGDGSDGAAGELGTFQAAAVGPTGEGAMEGTVECLAEEAEIGGGQIDSIEIFLQDEIDGFSLSLNAGVAGPGLTGQGFLADPSDDIVGLGPFNITFDDIPGVDEDRSFAFSGQVELDAGGAVDIEGSGSCTVVDPF